MELFHILSQSAQRFPSRIAATDGTSMLTYRQLADYSDRLALYLDGKCSKKGNPVLIYGHKSPFMLVCFLACMKAGIPYCPLDVSLPIQTVKMVLEDIQPSLVCALEPFPFPCNSMLSLHVFQEITQKNKIPDCDIRLMTAYLTPIAKDDVFCIMYACDSGETVQGVQISLRSLEEHLKSCVIPCLSASFEKVPVFLNQAPFSFDLSVTDIYTCLFLQGTLWCISETDMDNPRLLLHTFAASKGTVLISTPSFLEMCLVEEAFCAKQIPSLSCFLLGKEPLSVKTAAKLKKQFPDARIFNLYIPAPTALAVTSTEITEKLLQNSQILPSGSIKPGVQIEIRSETGTVLKDGDKGEIVILSHTSPPGYYKNPFHTKKTFFTEKHKTGSVQGFHTQDRGYLQDGVLFYCGRKDAAIRLSGHPVALDDVETGLMKLPQVSRAAVLPHIREHRVRNLYAYVVCPEKSISDKSYSARLKEDLLSILPEYMVPKKFIYVNRFPVSQNGKLDLNALKNMKTGLYRM